MTLFEMFDELELEVLDSQVDIDEVEGLPELDDLKICFLISHNDSQGEPEVDGELDDLILVIFLDDELDDKTKNKAIIKHKKKN